MRGRNCTDPRDKYYGLHAVLDRFGIQLGTRESLYQIHDLYKDLFLCLLHKTKTLKVLLCAWSPSLLGAPSWVPDWSRNEEQSWLYNGYLSLSPIDLPEFASGKHVISHYAACSVVSECAWSVRHDRELILFGKKAGRVTWKSQEFLETGDMFEESDMPTHIHNILILREFIARSYGPGLAWLELFRELYILR